MATLDSRYIINGLVDTAGTALDNMTAITNSCNTWLSYDALVGQWSVVINRAGNAAFSFNDNNIIGPINLTTTELTGYYNSCEVRFHNFDLRDREDYVLLEIPTNQRLPNEPDNRLIINAPMVNNQIQAQLIGLIELKQSRLDEIIEFTTDFSYINIEAGTIISVTNAVYGWTDKLFRVLTMTEQQSGDTIAIQITAQEYDANIYSDADLYLYLRDAEDGLIELDPLVDVSPVTASSAVVNASTGQVEPLAYTLPLLMTLLSGINGGQGNQMTTGIFNGFQQQTGNDLRNALVAAQIGSVNVGGIRQSTSTTDKIELGSTAFVAPRTGSYQILVVFDQNSSGSNGGRGSYWSEPLDFISGTVRVFDAAIGGTQIYGEGSGGDGAQFWQDFVTNGLLQLNGGQTYRVEFAWVNYTETAPSGTANVTTGWQILSYQ